MVQVLHGLRQFSTAERGWHFAVEGQCPGVVPFGVIIITSWEAGGGGCYYSCGEEQIVCY